jgi:hypothetical protein
METVNKILSDDFSLYERFDDIIEHGQRNMPFVSRVVELDH